ncbi:DNA helicase rad5 [Nowakowskiella sp. JEL0407]|nr:DNA helicase rad5 [Nowakowskiella sp. JEL0407]
MTDLNKEKTIRLLNHIQSKLTPKEYAQKTTEYLVESALQLYFTTPSIVNKIEPIIDFEVEEITNTDNAVKSDKNATQGVSSTSNSKEPMKFPVFISECFCTALSSIKGISTLNYGDKLRIDRATLKPDLSRKRKLPSSSSSNNSTSNFFKPKQTLPAGSESLVTNNTIVRLYKTTGTGRSASEREVGKLNKESATFISRLLDHDLASFECIVESAPTTLKLLDEFYVSIRVSLTHHAFKPIHGWKNGANSSDPFGPRNVGLNAGIVAELTPVEEHIVNEKRRALCELFRFLRIRPLVGAAVSETDEGTNPLSFRRMNSNMEDGVEKNAEDDAEGEVSVTDLNGIYQKAERLEQNVLPLDPAEDFKLELRPYQKKGLGFMVSKETKRLEGNLTNDENNPVKESLSPLWAEYRFPNRTKFWFSKYSGELRLDRPLTENCAGGILADDMGLGKTIQALALIHTHKRPESQPSSYSVTLTSADANNSKKAKVTGGSSSVGIKRDVKTVHRNSATLIICPLNVLGQWEREAKRCLPKELQVQLYYGTERKDRTLISRFHNSKGIVLTTLGTLASDYADNESSPLYNVEWWRIMIDEAHYIKEKATRNARACAYLGSQNRWCITGTPIVNRLEDLYSLVSFLRIHPWSQAGFFNGFVTTPFAKGGDARRSAMETVQTILEPILLRRTKDMKDANGLPIVPLPSKEIFIKYLDFSEEEQEIYQELHSHSKRRLSVLKNIGRIQYTHVFQLLCRLRQCCDHIMLIKTLTNVNTTDSNNIEILELQDLITRYLGSENSEMGQNGVESKGKSAGFAGKVIEQLERNERVECPICLEMVGASSDGILLPCLHVVCKDCVEGIVLAEKEGECPICRTKCTESDVLKILGSKSETTPDSQEENNNEEQEVNSSQGSTLKLTSMKFRTSTKLKAMIELLKMIRDEGSGAKIVVFSQWTSMLDIVELVLKEHGFAFLRLDGSLTQKARDQVLKTFQAENSKIPILIASLRSSGVGINITAASNVIILDLWWNEAVENQAIDRVHRIGQTNNVRVWKMVVKGTVEEKMLAIQKMKTQVAGVAMGDGSGLKMDEMMAMLQ